MVAKKQQKQPQQQPKPYKKEKIPRALHEAVWVTYAGRVFEQKCLIPWCPNIMTVFDYQTGHNIPESKGGHATLENLRPICSRCNQSMGNKFTIQEWSDKYHEPPPPPAVHRTGPWSRFLIWLRTVFFKTAPKASVAPALGARVSR